MPSDAQVSGVAVLMVLAGFTLTTSAIKNQPIADVVRALTRGQQVPSGPDEIGRILGRVSRQGVAQGAQGGVPAEASDLGNAVAETALSYIGVPYRWAGEDPSGWDCSGFVTYVLHTEHGIELPNNSHTVAAQFYVWDGAVTIPRSRCAAGDLVTWPSHIGIAVSRDEMVHAPGAGQKTRRQRIWDVPAPVIRRPKAYGRVGQAA